MKTRMAYTILALAIAGGCHRGSESVKRTDQQYQVVQEGSTNGVTSTLGDTAPLVATNTAVDTTTNFTLPATTAVSTGEPLPSNVPGYPLGGGGYTPPPAPRPMTRPAVQPRNPNPPMASSTARPSTTDTIATETAATETTVTDTATTVAPAPQQAPKKEEKKPEVQPQPAPQPAPQDQPQPQPPPPTQTDTNGAGHGPQR